MNDFTFGQALDTMTSIFPWSDTSELDRTARITTVRGLRIGKSRLNWDANGRVQVISRALTNFQFL